MSEEIVGILHPGAMGAAVGRALRARGLEVRWASQGRSQATRRRAELAGLSDAVTVKDLFSRCTVLLSICPPHAAVDIANAAAGFGGLYVDANAVSPQTVRRIADTVGPAAVFTDGGIIGPPPEAPGDTRLYLAGPGAERTCELFNGTPVEARVVEGGVGAASAVKAAYAGWTKGSAALLLTVRALAAAEGVESALLAEWAMSQPGLIERSRQAAQSATTKGWRWVAEMEEIAAALRGADLPDGFHVAAAEVFGRVPRSAAAAADDATLLTVLATLLGRQP
jgi:3-hydroxyisobutyrate dehydrogenase-like beta-hydroxyacid dehydrogenase